MLDYLLGDILLSKFWIISTHRNDCGQTTRLYRLNCPGQRSRYSDSLRTDWKVRGSKPGGGSAASYTLGTGSVIPEGKEAEVTDRVETYLPAPSWQVVGRTLPFIFNFTFNE